LLGCQRAFTWIAGDPRNIMPLFIRSCQETIVDGLNAGTSGFLKFPSIGRKGWPKSGLVPCNT
jgi:hypothetical protein